MAHTGTALGGYKRAIVGLILGFAGAIATLAAMVPLQGGLSVFAAKSFHTAPQINEQGTVAPAAGGSADPAVQ